jgi:hypothetical protein
MTPHLGAGAALAMTMLALPTALGSAPQQAEARAIGREYELPKPSRKWLGMRVL